MLSAELNRKMTQVGPGTPMGDLLRRYWMPIAGVSELDEKPIRRVRLLGENLVLYKDLSGQYGLVDRHCPHRRADMGFGIREENGLRCSYHGWQFAPSGQCVEAPYEDSAHPHLKMRDKVCIKAYPVEARGGLLWAYLGPLPAPEVPDWEPFSWENGFVQICIAEVPCNWLQAQENSIDPIHFEWQHDNYSLRRRDERANFAPSHQRVAFEEFDHGFVYKRIMEGFDETHDDWTVGRVCLWPNCLYVGHNFGWRVPIDDENMLSVSWDFRRVPREREPFRQERIPTWRSSIYDEDGEFLMSHVINQDFAAWVGQGTVSDRTGEHLGQSDRGVVMMRQRLMSDMKRIAEDPGADPKGIIRAPADNHQIPLPAMNREKWIKGMSMAEIEANPLIKLQLSRFILQAGQPDWVKKEYEDATGFVLPDEDSQPGRYHVNE